jgi:hypothetical protein
MLNEGTGGICIRAVAHVRFDGVQVTVDTPECTLATALYNTCRIFLSKQACAAGCVLTCQVSLHAGLTAHGPEPPTAFPCQCHVRLDVCGFA